MPNTENQKKSKLFLHVCCIGCGAHVAGVLGEEYNVTVYFYNPGIFPKEEYKKRLTETERVAKDLGLEFIAGDYDHEAWLSKVKGHEKDREGGERCLICFRDRLEQTARLALEKKFPIFGTTLTVSPHKNAASINQIGREIALKYNISFVAGNYKKQDGFKKACALSRELGLYRQNYCGCEFSIRE